MASRSGRAVIIHHLDQAKAALAVAADLGVPIVLCSAPGAAATLGAMVFVRIIEQARAAVPEAEARAILDCGNDPGFAMNALRHGVDGVSCDVTADVRQRLADIAAQSNASVETIPSPVLDLGLAEDAAAACRDWLTVAE